MPESYIVRFKVLTVECPLLTQGQQYTITYRRGETYRSTPCYMASTGFVDFSAMPEGSALVHFKNGGLRFLPKWITLRVEEYTRSRARKGVGETKVDCAEVLGLYERAAAAKRRVNFNLYGTAAAMTIGLLVYPETHAPLSFSSIIPQPQSGDVAQQSGSAMSDPDLKRLSNRDAVALLLKLEGLLERRRVDEVHRRSEMSPLELRVSELEERRRSFSSVEGMATQVVEKRTSGLAAMRFMVLSRKWRSNYTGDVAAYLRQIAVASGVPLTADISPYLSAFATDGVIDPETARARLQRIDDRIKLLSEQGQQLELEKLKLMDSQGQMGRNNFSEALQGVQTKISALESQKKLLMRSRDPLEKVSVCLTEDSSPLAREVREIGARIQALTAEESRLRESVASMTAVAVNHVLKWARGKNNSCESIHTVAECVPKSAQYTTMDQLSQVDFQQLQQLLQQELQLQKQHHHQQQQLEPQTPLQPPPQQQYQPPQPPQQLQEQLQDNGVQPSSLMASCEIESKAEDRLTHTEVSTSTVSSVKQVCSAQDPRPSVHELLSAQGLPSMNDFSSTIKDSRFKQEAIIETLAKTPVRHTDPLGGLESSMFESTRIKEQRTQQSQQQRQEQCQVPQKRNDSNEYSGWNFGVRMEDSDSGARSSTFRVDIQQPTFDSTNVTSSNHIGSTEDNMLRPFGTPLNHAVAAPGFRHGGQNDLQFDSPFGNATVNEPQDVHGSYTFEATSRFGGVENETNQITLPSYNFGSTDNAFGDTTQSNSRPTLYSFGS
ncbi:hypothetical protein ERJ75_001319000 [Trypanosoma vivax]|nr:hypothetical protein ERJ75_001319000 [Trypanosoma vivax]